MSTPQGLTSKRQCTMHALLFSAIPSCRYTSCFFSHVNHSFALHVAHGTHIPPQVETCFERQWIGIPRQVQLFEKSKKGKKAQPMHWLRSRRSNSFNRKCVSHFQWQRCSVCRYCLLQKSGVFQFAHSQNSIQHLVSKDQLPSVIRAVGYTCHVCNIVASAPNRS